MRNSRPGRFAFLILLYNWWNESLVAHASEVNVTVDDTDSSILYVPSGSWHSNSVPCSFCLEPDSALAYQKTFHDGTHIIPTVDGDDLPNSSISRAPRSTSAGYAATSSTTSHAPSSTSSRSPTSTPPSQAPRPTPQTTAPGDDDDDDDDDDHGHDSTSHTRRQEEEFNPFATSKFDADDPEFVDQPVFVQYNFTGTAVYIYCLLPEAAAPPNTMPTTVNLTFTLDDQTFDPYHHTGDSSKSGFLSNVNVFFADGLSNAPHTVRVDIGPNSVFLFDYLIYTQVRSTGDAESSNSDDSAAKHHNVATFAGAVGGSVGVLAVFAAGLAISIYYRRLRSARRLRRERDNESLHTEGSEDSPRMYGPAPFMPRYFPGTVPTAPPPYIPSTSTSSLSDSSPVSPYSPLMSNASSIPVTMTYADLPPALPLALEDVLLADDVPSVPPPSFGEAIASPLTIPLSLSPPPGIPSPVLSSISNERSTTPRVSGGLSNSDLHMSSPPPFTPSDSSSDPPAFTEAEDSSRTPESRPPSRGIRSSVTEPDHEVGVAR